MYQVASGPMQDLYNLYNRLPIPAKSLVSTVQSLYHRGLYGGEENERLFRGALARDAWTSELWGAWRERRLAWVLNHAATRVPYYRMYWQARRLKGDRSDWERLENWPTLDKEALREHPLMFVADDCSIDKMECQMTTGTTGRPIATWLRRATIRALSAISDARTLGWQGVPRGSRSARIDGRVAVPASRRRPPYWTWNLARGQLALSAYHMSHDTLPEYLDALKRHRVRYLVGRPSLLLPLARTVVRLARRDLEMLAIFTNSEPVTAGERAMLGEAFQCDVVETYGMAESVAAASQCDAGRLHIWPEVGEVEVLDADGVRVADGATGDLVCTSLLNADMPLIRYQVGDRGSLAPAGSRCLCGREAPAIASIVGHSSDLLVTRDGRQISWLNPVFFALPIRESQIVQDSLGRLSIRVVPATGFGPEHEQLLRHRLRERVGGMIVDLKLVSTIARSSTGELPAVICNISAEERVQALGSRERIFPSLL